MLFIRTEEHAKKEIEPALQEAFDGKLECVAVDALFDGLRLLRDRSFDLVVSDLILHDSTGVPTVRHLKQQAPGIPVIVLCDFKDRAAALTAVRKGAHDFLCYEDLRDPENLRRAVAGALRSGDEEHSNQPNAADRRTHARFPCRLAVSYQALEHPFLSGTATSETLNISSKGLLFTTEEPLQPGQLLQVSVDWPAMLDNQVPLKLVAEGRIVRNINGQAAMRIDKYEFRTRRLKNPAAAAGDPVKNKPPFGVSPNAPPGGAKISETKASPPRFN